MNDTGIIVCLWSSSDAILGCAVKSVPRQRRVVSSYRRMLKSIYILRCLLGSILVKFPYKSCVQSNSIQPQLSTLTHTNTNIIFKMGFGDEIKDVENAVDGQEYVFSFKAINPYQDLSSCLIKCAAFANARSPST